MECEPLPDHPDELQLLLDHATRCRDQYQTVLENFPGVGFPQERPKDWLGKVSQSLEIIANYLDGPRDVGNPLDGRRLLELSESIQRLRREIRAKRGTDRPQFAVADHPGLETLDRLID
jgi:hypothetical protein